MLAFGGASGVRPLQAMETPLGPEAGPGIAAALRFDQDNSITDVPMAALMASLTHLLATARAGFSSGAIVRTMCCSQHTPIKTALLVPNISTRLAYSVRCMPYVTQCLPAPVQQWFALGLVAQLQWPVGLHSYISS